MTATALPRAPGFGAPLQTERYYLQTNQIIRTLRGKATQRTICAHMNAMNILTPSGLPWDVRRLTNYLQSTAFAADAQSLSN